MWHGQLTNSIALFANSGNGLILRCEVYRGRVPAASYTLSAFEASSWFMRDFAGLILLHVVCAISPQEALAAEQYDMAAELRDRGLVGLVGWWAGKDGPDDFQGHLLHVKSEFGRWTGRIYMARDIAAMNGWRENKLAALLDRAPERNAAVRGSSGGTNSGLGSGTIGTPMMEVFVRQQQFQHQDTVSSTVPEASAGAQLVPSLLFHQAVALRPPASKRSKDGGNAKVYERAGSSVSTKGTAGAVGGNGAQLNPASVVRLCIIIARDGSARINVLPPKIIKSQFSSREEEEMRATMAALAVSTLWKEPLRLPGQVAAGLDN